MEDFKKVSCAIKCVTGPERDKTIEHFKELGYSLIGDSHGMVIFINPFNRQLLTTSIEIAEENFKDNNYNIVDFATFITFIV